MEQVNDKYFLFSIHVIVDNFIWCFAIMDDCFFKIDLTNNRVSYVTSFEGIKPSEEIGGTDALTYANDCIYKIGSNGKFIHKYNMHNKKCTYIKWIGEPQWVSYYRYIFTDEKCIYFICRDGNLYKLILKTDEVIKIDKIYSVLNRTEWVVGSIVKSKRLYLFINDRCNIIVYNLTTDKIDYIELNQDINGCKNFYSDGEFVWLLDYNNVIWKVIIEQEYIERVFELQLKQEIEISCFVVLEKRIYLLPLLDTEIYLVDLKQETFSIWKEYPEDFCYLGKSHWAKYFGYSIDENYIIFSMRSANYLLLINRRTEEIEWRKLIVPKVMEKWNYLINEKKSTMIYEEEKMLQLFIESIVNR